MEEMTWADEGIPPGHRSGFVAVIGKPNVGKSTLMNALLGQKVAIVSPKPQTTRRRLHGILTLEHAQIIFMDTPGIHRPLHKLGEAMVYAAQQAIEDADVLLWLVDVTHAPTKEDQQIAELVVQRGEVPLLLALNKIDAVDGARLRANQAAYLALTDPTGWLPISATRGDNLEELLTWIVDHLPEGPRYYPPDLVTDQPERFIAAELIREQVLYFTRQEVPHAVAVAVEEFEERSEDLTYIRATIFVERATQKAILLGEGGQMIKQIGQAARKEIERLVGTRVYLDLWVKVRPKWRRREEELRRMGYALPPGEGRQRSSRRRKRRR